MQLADGLVSVHRHGRHWLLARHRGRAALVVSHADKSSCRMARRLMDGYGHQRLDWLLLLDPVPSAGVSCWQGLARHVSAMQQGQPALAPGQRLISAGLSVELLAHRGEPLLLRIGRQRWQVLLRPQSLWSLQDADVLEHRHHRHLAGIPPFISATPLADGPWRQPEGRRLKF